MATRPSVSAGRSALERARARVPGLAPASAEVVELVRGRPYVVVLVSPGGLVVLDPDGRLVRRREVIDAIARHRHALASLDATMGEARLERRLEHAARGVLLLGPSPAAEGLVAELVGLSERLEGLLDPARSGAPLTERTLRRRAAELNDAARADRRVVREARRLAASTNGSKPATKQAETLRRWLCARLASADLPFFHPELAAAGEAQAVARFRAALRK